MPKATLTILLATTLLLQVATSQIVIVIPCFACDPVDSTTRELGDYNAKYDGNLTVTLEVPTRTCTYTETVASPSVSGGPTIPPQRFEVGVISPKANASLSREAWDKNPFYFKLDAYQSSKGTLANLDMQSSQDTHGKANSSAQTGQFWNLNATKSGDGWDVQGRLSLASKYNYWVIAECGLQPGNAQVSTNWSMTGRITNRTVKMEGKGEVDGEWLQTWRYEGTWNNASAMLNSSDELIQTYGKLGNNSLSNGAERRMRLDTKLVGVGLAFGITVFVL